MSQRTTNARGMGSVSRIEGAGALQRRFGAHIVWNTLSQPGTSRRDWLQTLVSDGFIMLRYADLAETIAMADAVGNELHLFAE